MKKVIFGLATSENHARRIVDHLLSSGFSNEDISILSPEHTRARTPTNLHGDTRTATDVHGDTRTATNLHGDTRTATNLHGDTRTATDGRGDFRNTGDVHGTVAHDEHLHETHPKKSRLTTEKHTKAPEGGAAGAAAGGILGGSLGLLAGIGALAIPGLGAFVAAGPIMAALSGSAVGGSVGLLVGSLIGLGIPEYEAKQYEAALKGGKGFILISVHTDNSEELNQAHEILKKEGAQDISSTVEKAGRQ